jgi:hypothetical protein
MLLGLDQAQALGVPVPVREAAGVLWAQAYAQGQEAEDFSAIIKLVEHAGGAEVRARDTTALRKGCRIFRPRPACRMAPAANIERNY